MNHLFWGHVMGQGGAGVPLPSPSHTVSHGSLWGKQPNANEQITGDADDQSCCLGCITRLWKVFHKHFTRRRISKREHLPTCLQLQARLFFFFFLPPFYTSPEQ